ncbi:MAG: hypothetical protein WCC67_16595, partial [Candidatus Acidiferrales bacterium]
MNLLFYARLIGLTAGTLVYLFLLALILGHRRPRMLERLLFFLLFALFLIYAGALLEMNALIQYVSPPNATRFFYDGLQALGAFLLLPLVWHTHYAYGRQVRKSPTGVFSRAFVVMFYLIALLGLGMGLSLLWGGATDSGRLLTLHYFLQGGRSLLPVIALLDAVLELRDWRKATDSVERRMFQCLFVVSGLLAVLLVLLRIFGAVSASRTDVILTATISAGILPGVVLVYFFLRHNFLEYGAQRNLVYALSATFLALLYLALVRRVGTWLEPVLPPEATASFLLFVLIFLFEPLERVIGRYCIAGCGSGWG